MLFKLRLLYTVCSSLILRRSKALCMKVLPNSTRGVGGRGRDGEGGEGVGEGGCGGGEGRGGRREGKGFELPFLFSTNKYLPWFWSENLSESYQDLKAFFSSQNTQWGHQEGETRHTGVTIAAIVGTRGPQTHRGYH